MKHRPKILTLILAGGAGGRLDVLTKRRAKPAMPYAGMLRLIDFALSNATHSGLSDVWVVEQYQLHTLNDHLANGRPWDLDRTYGGLQVLPPSEEDDEQEGDDKESSGFAHGNADAIYRQRKMIREFAPDLLLVLSADHVYKLDFRDVIDRHLERRADVTMVTTRLPAGDDASRYGVVQVDGAGRVTGFAYKPDQPEGDLVTAEIFVYDAAKLLAALEELMEAEGELKDYGDALLPKIVERGNAWEFRLESYWRDVGTLDSYWQAHMDLLGPSRGPDLEDQSWPILTHAAQRPPARLLRGSEAVDSLIAPGCQVAGRVVRSVLGPGVKVEAGATVEDAVVLRDATISAGARVRRAIVDEEASIGANAQVGGDGDLAVVGTAVRVADGAVVKPGARLAPEEEEIPLPAGPA